MKAVALDSAKHAARTSTTGYQLTLSAKLYHLTGRCVCRTKCSSISTNTSLLACRETSAWLQSLSEASCFNAETRPAALSAALCRSGAAWVCVFASAEYRIALQDSAVFILAQCLLVSRCRNPFQVQRRWALTGLGSISLDGAFSPRQWILERLEEIEDAPADNDVIIEAHKTANLRENERKQPYLFQPVTQHSNSRYTNSTGDGQHGAEHTA